MLPRGMSKSALNSTKFYNKVNAVATNSIFNFMLCSQLFIFFAQNNKLYWKVHVVFAISPNFDPGDLLSPELHNCQSFSGRKSVGSAQPQCEGADRDASGETGGDSLAGSGGREFAVLRKKRPIDDISISGIARRSESSPAAVGALVGVCADGVDEDASLNDLFASFLTSRGGAVLSHTLRSLRACASSCSSSGSGSMDIDPSDTAPTGPSWLCLIQQIPSPASAPVFLEVPTSFSLRDALEGGAGWRHLCIARLHLLLLLFLLLCCACAYYR